MSRVVLSGPAARVLIASGVVILFALIIYSMSGFPAPREADRITALDGSFSVIKPRDWESRTMQSPPGSASTAAIEIYSSKAIGLGERLSVIQLSQNIDAAKLKSLGFALQQFQGQDAWVRGLKNKAEYNIQLFFQRPENIWYQVDLHLNRQEEMEKSDWWPFVMSVKCNPVRRDAPATQATLPSPASP